MFSVCQIELIPMTLKGFPVGLVVQNLPANAGDAGSVPELGRSPEEGRQPIPVFLPGKPHGQRSLMYCRLWRHRIRHDFTTQQEIAFRKLNICKGQR